MYAYSTGADASEVLPKILNTTNNCSGSCIDNHQLDESKIEQRNSEKNQFINKHSGLIKKRTASESSSTCVCMNVCTCVHM